jgi:hypothetical protein
MVEEKKLLVVVLGLSLWDCRSGIQVTLRLSRGILPGRRWGFRSRVCNRRGP